MFAQTLALEVAAQNFLCSNMGAFDKRIVGVVFSFREIDEPVDVVVGHSADQVFERAYFLITSPDVGDLEDCIAAYDIGQSLVGEAIRERWRELVTPNEEDIGVVTDIVETYTIDGKPVYLHAAKGNATTAYIFLSALALGTSGWFCALSEACVEEVVEILNE